MKIRITALEEELLKERQLNEERDKKYVKIKSLTDGLKGRFDKPEHKLPNEEPGQRRSYAAAAATSAGTMSHKFHLPKPQKEVNKGELEDRKRNIVIHGIAERSGENLTEKIKEMCASASIDLHDEDIIRLQRLRHPLDKSKREVPVVLSLSSLDLKSEIMQQRNIIRNGDTKLVLAEDEPRHIRLFKNKLRRIIKHCVNNSTDAQMLDQGIEINGTIYNFDNCNSIPKHYLPSDMTTLDLSNAPPTDARQSRDVTIANVDGREAKLVEERMKRTNSGYTYNGETATFSNFYKCNIKYVFQGKEFSYTSLEQAYAHIKCLANGDVDRARRVMQATKPLACKQIANPVIVSVEWENYQEELMELLITAKFEQNPDLALKLIATSPFPLIESTLCEKWGGAAIFGSDKYDNNTYLGQNRQGKILAKVRDILIGKKKGDHNDDATSNNNNLPINQRLQNVSLETELNTNNLQFSTLQSGRTEQPTTSSQSKPSGEQLGNTRSVNQNKPITETTHQAYAQAYYKHRRKSRILSRESIRMHKSSP